MHPPRLVRAAAPLVIGALLLTGCGSSSKSSSSGKKSYTIGFQLPLSGSNAQLGINMLDGAKLAVEQANAKGDLGFTVKIAQSDDAGNPADSPAAAQKLIDNSAVVAVLGPGFSATTFAAEPHFKEAGLVSVSPSATRADLTSSGFTNFFRVITGDTAQGKKMADFVAVTLKSKSAYVVDDKSAYGAGLVKFVKDELTAKGVKFTSEGLAAPATDYSALATKVVRSKADTLVYGGYYSDFALFTKAVRTAGFTGNIISGDGSKDPHFIQQAGASSANAYLTCPCGPTASSAAAQKFATDYKAKYNVDPGTYSAEAFDAANIIIAAIKGAGSNVTRATVLAGVKATSGFVGVTHTITFDANGEGGTGQIYAYQVKGGQIVLLGEIVDGAVKK